MFWKWSNTYKLKYHEGINLMIFCKVLCFRVILVSPLVEIMDYISTIYESWIKFSNSGENDEA